MANNEEDSQGILRRRQEMEPTYPGRLAVFHLALNPLPREISQ
jgi:hypothetical protein